jgi:AcrR family transcriptional regulator
MTRKKPRAPRRTREDVLRDFRTDQILAAATHVIGKLGFAEASIDRIAEEAGVARSTVYVYFGSKEEILDRCLNRHREGLGARVREAVAAERGIEAQLAAFFRAVLGYVGEVREFFRALMALRGLDPFFGGGDVSAPALETLREETQRVVDGIFADARAAKVLGPEAEAKARAVLPMLLYGALMRRAMTPGPADAAQEAADLARVFLYGALEA